MEGHESHLYPAYVIETIRSAEVASLFFPYAMRSWILDMRRTLTSAPRVVLDGIVGTPQERIKSFKRIRPELPTPGEITVIPWIGHARQLEETGILEAIYERCRWEGDDALAAEAASCYQSLLRAETAIKRQIILGVGMQPVWQRPRG